MKKIIMIICIPFLTFCAFALRYHFISSIYGSIDPPDAGKKVLAINGKDSLVVVPQAGKFSIAVTPGKWTLHIEASGPYKNAVLENVMVTEGRSTDVGLIRLRSQ